MGKKSRLKRQRRERRESRPVKAPAGIASWVDDEGVHAVVPGKAPSPEKLEEMTRLYQQNVRESPIWDKMVRQFGSKKAEELLRKFKAELK